MTKTMTKTITMTKTAVSVIPTKRSAEGSHIRTWYNLPRGVLFHHETFVRSLLFPYGPATYRFTSLTSAPTGVDLKVLDDNRRQTESKDKLA